MSQKYHRIDTNNYFQSSEVTAKQILDNLI